ncbi:hypothetical protein BKA70DRAFT_1220260 [Coprinopsis sp. MPI-PUGE-AT-0042]|nr:hypothetical protein BKA70DRAFT_1220260 [Coprinopsis sp. MPI-PUGE-AT-0042]
MPKTTSATTVTHLDSSDVANARGLSRSQLTVPRKLNKPYRRRAYGNENVPPCASGTPSLSRTMAPTAPPRDAMRTTTFTNRMAASGPANSVSNRRGGSSDILEGCSVPILMACGDESRCRLLESKLGRVEKECSEVCQELQATIARCRAAKDELKEAQSKIKILEADLKEARGELDEMAGELSETEDDLRTARKERDEYRLWWRNEVHFSRVLMGNASPPFNSEIGIARHGRRP